LVNVECACTGTRDIPVTSHLAGWVPLTLIDDTVLVFVLFCEFNLASVSHTMNFEFSNIVFSSSFDQVVLNF